MLTITLLQVLDAIESIPKSERPRFVTVSALDTRDMNKAPPQHYVRDICDRRCLYCCILE